MTASPATSTRVTPLDVDGLRRRFPALERREGGHPVAYFDGPGGTQVPAEVVDAMRDYLLHHNANTHWAYPTSLETDAVLSGARAALADFIGGAPDEIAFGANMTTLAFHLARSLARGWKAGDEVVVTELDHHANVAPWEAVARERGVVLRTVRFDPASGELDWAELERALGARTRLLAIGAASNALGTVTDVARAAALAHAAGALVFVDAVHYAPHRLLDVHALGADFAACSAYKFYGPHIGVLWGRRHRIEALDVPKLRPAPEAAPERLETGTQNHEGIAGALAAVEFLASLSPGSTRRERLAAFYLTENRRAEALTERLWDGLGAIPGVTRFGPPPGRPRTSTVSFTLAGRPARAVAGALAPLGLFLSHGDFYASTVVERLGHAEDGLVRAGLAIYSTGEEVDRLVAAVAALR
ncbi:MAG TPA: cysteine desulfurase-like protein [Gemmatimonadales bacterium]|nr:cysteine desulfurase-like protein [Gemmatimonadales bacterium]